MANLITAEQQQSWHFKLWWNIVTFQKMCCTNVGLSDAYGRGVLSRTIAIAGSISIRPKITVAGRDIFKVLPCMMDTIGPSPTDFRLGFQELFGTIICGNRCCKTIKGHTKHVWNVLPVIPIDSLYRFSQDFDAPLLVEDSRLLLRADDGTGGWMAWQHLGRHLWAKILRACPKLG